MKRVYFYLICVGCLLIVTPIVLGFLNYIELTVTVTLNLDSSIIFIIIFSVAFCTPLFAIFLVFLIRQVIGLFKPKFLRIADNLEIVIKRKIPISRKLGISLRKEQVIDKMEHIWRKAEMQYPLSELDFEKIMGANPNA